MLTIGSLFAGAGGLDLGLERAGLGPVLWQVEIDTDARAVLRKHWPNAELIQDVRFVKAGRTRPVDLVCGGFPCQDVSNAGSKLGLDGARSGLWFEFARVVRELRPRIVLVENVAALLRRGIDTVLGTLAALGYDACWDCVPAAALGAPHRRDRLFLVAWRVSNPDGESVRVESERGQGRAQAADERDAESRHVGGDVADSDGCGREASGLVRSWEPDLAGDGFVADSMREGCEGRELLGSFRPDAFGDLVADPNRWRLAIERVARRHEERGARWNDPDGYHLPAWPFGPGDERWSGIPPEAQPAIRGVVDGFPSRVAQLRLAGNAVSPVVAEALGEIIVCALRDSGSLVPGGLQIPEETA